MIQIHPDELSSYIRHPSMGRSANSDSLTKDIEYMLDGEEYYATVDIYVEYDRWYYPESYDSPEQDDMEVNHMSVEILDLVDSEGGVPGDIPKHQEYIQQNIEVGY